MNQKVGIIQVVYGEIDEKQTGVNGNDTCRQ